MKPIKLQFKGINSFSEQTEIDFERLTKNGIFGIFGDTGSGKSTILDGINFALYGKVERSREKVDIINYRCDSAEVTFVFDVLSEGKRKRYSVERSLKRKSGLHKASLYEDDLCIADNASSVTKKITEVLGVDAEDFRKCIALPQGEFSQFVKSQPSERIALIERLFSLSKYGDRLKERLKVRESQAELNYQTLSAKLSLFADVSPENIKNLDEQIADFKINAQKLSAESVTADSEYVRLKALSERRAELDEVVKNLAVSELQKQRMEWLRTGVKTAPLCKTAVQTDDEITSKNAVLQKINKSIEDIKIKSAEEEKKLIQLNSVSEKENYDEQIAKCITLSAKYSACEGKPEKLAVIESELGKKRSEYRVKDEELSKLKVKLNRAEAEVKQVETKLSEFGAKDLEYLINVKFKGAVLKEEYVNSLDYFVGLNGQVQFHKDGSELYEFIERELKQQIAIYKDRVYQVKDFNLEEAREQLKNLRAADEEREKLTSLLNEKKSALKDIQSAINDCEKDLKIIHRDGETLRAHYNEIREELTKVFGTVKDFAGSAKQNDQNLTALKQRKARLAAETDETNKRLTDLASALAAAQSEQKSVIFAIDNLNDKLKNLLNQLSFDSVEECKKITEEFSEYTDAEKTLEEYDSKLLTLRARRTQLENTEGINNYSEQALADSENRKNSVALEFSQLREKIAVLEAERKKAEERLKEKKLLQSDLDTAEKERNLIFQLKDLTKGNKFMEYIANEYLYDISSLASSTLLNLTDGRYFLTYTDTFYAGDNFNCGNLRGVNTLSGGETFLVSLSLALALSQTICASLKSIEFFFLDEGFGTLDGTLVDTVMNALEKLKSSRFTIGVISHVEELKHRIDNKITVNKATETHGSTVQISG